VKYNTKVEVGYHEVGPFIVDIITLVPCISYESCKCKSILLWPFELSTWVWIWESRLILHSFLKSCFWNQVTNFSQVLMQLVGNMYKKNGSNLYLMDHQSWLSLVYEIVEYAKDEPIIITLLIHVIRVCLENLTTLSLWWAHLDLSMLTMEYTIGMWTVWHGEIMFCKSAL
jgi:hypothetical protein